MRFFGKESQNGEEQNSTKPENTLSGFGIPQRLSRLFARSETPQSLVDNPEAEQIFREHNLKIDDLETACQAEIGAVLGSGAEEREKPYRATTGLNDPIKEDHKRANDLLPEKDLSEQNVPRRKKRGRGWKESDAQPPKTLPKSKNHDKSTEKTMAEKIESMQNYAREIAEEIKSEYGQEVPIAGDLRIDMGEYGEIMGEKLQRDYKNLEEKNFQHSKGIDWGEAMELFSTLMMYRFFKSKGILAVRASKYDDVKYGVDTVIFNPKNGDVIGAFDAMVGENKDERMALKKSKTFIENLQNKGKLDYGLNVKDGKIIKERRSDVPIFCFGLSKSEFKNALNEIDFSNKNTTCQEDAIMAEFLNSVVEQIDEYQVFSRTDCESIRKFFEKMSNDIKNINY